MLWGPIKGRAWKQGPPGWMLGADTPVLGVWAPVQSSHRFPQCGFRLLSLQTRKVTDLRGGTSHSKHRVPVPLGISPRVTAGQLLGSEAGQGAMARVAPA